MARRVKLIWVDGRGKFHSTVTHLPPSAEVGTNWWKKKTLLPKASRRRCRGIVGWL